MRSWKGWVLLVAAGPLSACSGVPSVDSAEQEIAAFHKQLDAEAYGAIWRASTPEMQKASSEQDLANLLGAIHRKLGKVVSSEQVGWNSNMTTSGSFAQVQMQTTFEHGKGAETFIYRKVGEEMKLQGYNINSNDMMLK